MKTVGAQFGQDWPVFCVQPVDPLLNEPGFQYYYNFLIMNEELAEPEIQFSVCLHCIVIKLPYPNSELPNLKLILLLFRSTRISKSGYQSPAMQGLVKVQV